MRQCPACRKWTLDFDDYFGRFRCYNPDCAWMPASTTERELNLLRTHKKPTILESVSIPELGITVIPSYDPDNDALSMDFGLDEPTFDLPEPDGRMIWKIGYRSDSVAGFTILGAQRLGLYQIDVNFIARKNTIEHSLKKISGVLSSGRVTREAIEHIIVTAVSDAPDTSANELPNIFREMFDRLERFQSEHSDSFA